MARELLFDVFFTGVFNVEIFSSRSDPTHPFDPTHPQTCFLGQPPGRARDFTQFAVEKSVEKTAQLPRCYDHSECFSGLHHSRATLT